jgi:hypothetical protein
MHAVSSVCLIIIMGCCLAGIFSPWYRDNWAQFWGLVGILFWSAARLAAVLEGAEVTDLQLWAHVSMASYALGEAYRTWHEWRRSHPPYHVGPT